MKIALIGAHVRGRIRKLGPGLLSGPTPTLRVCNCFASLRTKYPLDASLGLGSFYGLCLGFLRRLSLDRSDFGFYLASRRKEITYLLEP